MHRQELEREAGLEASRSYALKRLQEAMQSEQVPANLEAFTQAIKRIHALGSRAIQRPTLRAGPPAQSRRSQRDTQRHSQRTRGRRTMGRQGGR
jgi:hypothetical protein